MNEKIELESGCHFKEMMTMKKSRFTNEQIAFALKQAESGVTVEEVCRKLGISQQTFYLGRRSLMAWVWRKFTG
ncbi:Transposase [Calycomorphotria hydatis]|uniref:Transposase n=1 Tax=Calycomorphotria hydatis TaxID=2528027 RepID=A0A517TA39_9PLAN|nr:Transposase [Calycomorphotria hydatis]